MKKRTRVIVLSIIGLIIALFLVFYITVVITDNNYIEASQPKIAEDISANETTLLLDEFGISLPLEAEITAFSVAEDEIKIRIEGVEDLPTFLIDSIYLGIDEEEAEILTDIFYQESKNGSNLYTDMYGTDHQSWGFPVSSYPDCPFDYSTRIRFFLLNEKIVIEIRKSNITIENRQALRNIVDKSM